MAVTMRFRLSPELFDGDNWGIVNTPEAVAEAVQQWAELADKNLAADEVESCAIETVLMSDEEFDALPQA